ncbi:hypothetical protein [Candidatus Contubernalis alkaliaceticus]|uniref:hypothetical protein n=1 Tax=Candidatus Contubernalis alkaliaceticus TaxID=338645 RepID=UPI001F4BFEEF|nr:hypothetical protein [Candidatus Contubernalis alkalaceticus]UNC92303.1 hypothetical protein HUE98_09460 [Candidatus Contubernalis alkalaceticus]
MKITNMNLHLPLPKLPTSTKIYVKEIKTQWNEKSLKEGSLPRLSKTQKFLKTSPGQEEIVINVTEYYKICRKKIKSNHGIYIKIKNKNNNTNQYDYPYVITDTI